ncbi:50S ribosomal protein L11 methyltransferase [Streptomyces oceani]|uniref:Methylase n=1 Tax=Streptomyces oceani TaxID=1075402 RepID=A0A1E7KPH4_9ACTN|nr:class I SAM-dependent methyltransferase [Streptomyces oceani]OEV05839.1 methylase [Streptomyces oceani]
MGERRTLHWVEDGTDRWARWRSESGAKPPGRVLAADDRMRADAAYKLVCEGTALLWRGDYQNARQLLTALGARVDRKARRPRARARTSSGTEPAAEPQADFHRHRARQAQRARILGMLLVELDGGYALPLRRAPEVADACAAALGPADGEPSVLSLRELLGLLGAWEWQRNGVPVPALGGERIHPSYGVFSPVRGEYVDLVAEEPLPAGGTELAYDVGTGTGVLAAVLARRGVRRVLATDSDPRALACAAENAERLGMADRITVTRADLFPPGRAPLVVCNPPWLPAKPTSPLERAVYDPGSRMVRGFLSGLTAHLAPGGEGWLILSDLAERLELRERGELEHWIRTAGLRVLGRGDRRPRHPRAADPDDPLHAARAAEVTSLWRLAAAV